MANNRMYLLCVPCAVSEDVSIDDSRFYLGKYYPSSGWYCDPKNMLTIDEWWDRHKHGTMFGEDFTLVYESLFGSAEKEKRLVLETISQYVEEVQRKATGEPDV